jgi:hypothetical protein
MRFPSKKSLLTGILFLGCIVLLSILTARILFLHRDAWEPRAILIMMPAGLLLWFWFGTYYSIRPGTIEYHSGPFFGKIQISSIKKIKKNKGLFVGLRAALAFGGMVLTFNRWDEIYISPRDPEEFIHHLLEQNPQIEIEGFSDTRGPLPITK